MAVNGHNGDSASRLDRMEKLMELVIDDHLKFQDEHRALLKAQVLLTDNVDKLAGRVGDLTDKVNAIAEAQRHTDEKLNALIYIVDDIVRKRPPLPPQ
jgi:cell division septum initiation protein DivIVA